MSASPPPSATATAAAPSIESPNRPAPAPAPAPAIEHPQAAELGVYVDTLIKQLQAKFDDMSGHIISKIDTMADRLDDLEKSIAELMQNAEAAAASGQSGGPDGTSAPVSSSRPASSGGGQQA